MPVIKSFLPIINLRSKVLVLGSMPGKKSLDEQEYYAYPQNQFWKIMVGLLGYELPLTYAQKKKMLLQNRIALWDVVCSCTRKGSLDSNIRNVKANNFGALFKKYRNIKVVFCNGNTALKLFKDVCPDDNLPIYLLPSTSPANTKLLAWKANRWTQDFESRLE